MIALQDGNCGGGDAIFAIRFRAGRRLGTELNVELLEHRGRYVQLTPAATKLMEHVDVMTANGNGL